MPAGKPAGFSVLMGMATLRKHKDVQPQAPSTHRSRGNRSPKRLARLKHSLAALSGN